MKQKFTICAILSIVTCVFYISLKINSLCYTRQNYSDDNHLLNQIFPSDEVSRFENNYREEQNPKYLEFVRRRYISGPPSLRDISLKEYHFNSDYSQVGQSLLVDKLLESKREGFFVECGAASGEFFSNSLYLELKLNWTGLLVEPNPIFFQELQDTSRNAFISNVCLSPKKTSSKEKFELHSWWGGISSHLDHTDPLHSNILVQCFPLHVLLTSIGVSHVDYLSLDVEGAEMDVLKTIPFDEVYVDIIGVEYRVNNQGGTAAKIDPEKTKAKLQSIREFFKNTNLYSEVGILPNDVSMSKTSVEENGLDIFFQRVPSKRTGKKFLNY